MLIIKDLSHSGRVIAPTDSRLFRSGVVILDPDSSVGEHTTGEWEEVLVILEGVADIVVEGESGTAAAGQLIYIEPNRRHNVFNRSSSILRYIYIVVPV